MASGSAASEIPVAIGEPQLPAALAGRKLSIFASSGDYGDDAVRKLNVFLRDCRVAGIPVFSISHHVQPGWHVLFVVEHSPVPRFVAPVPIYTQKLVQVRHFRSHEGYDEALADANAFLATAGPDSIRRIVNIYRSPTYSTINNKWWLMVRSLSLYAIPAIRWNHFAIRPCAGYR